MYLRKPALASLVFNSEDWPNLFNSAMKEEQLGSCLKCASNGIQKNAKTHRGIYLLGENNCY